MGQFSWFTNDSRHRIRIHEPFTVYLCDNKGNKYKETCYAGYGVFGGKDYFELLAEMNGISGEDKEEIRQKGIDLAFNNSPDGYNPDIIHPSLSENGRYYNGLPPISDPNQGWPVTSVLVVIPTGLLKKGMNVQLPLQPTFTVCKVDEQDVSVSLESLNELEKVAVNDNTPFSHYIVKSADNYGLAILQDVTSNKYFTYSGKVLISSEKVIHSYMGNNNETGDLVVCNNCETSMLLPVGTDICPCCHGKGYLSYYDHAEKDVYTQVSDLQIGNNIVITHDRPSDNELYS